MSTTIVGSGVAGIPVVVSGGVFFDEDLWTRRDFIMPPDSAGEAFVTTAFPLDRTPNKPLGLVFLPENDGRPPSPRQASRSYRKCLKCVDIESVELSGLSCRIPKNSWRLVQPLKLFSCSSLRRAGSESTAQAILRRTSASYPFANRHPRRGLRCSRLLICPARWRTGRCG